MNSNVTALVVAVVGVAGTLFAALLTQLSYTRAKRLELKDQRDQREEERQQANVRERREAYIALNAAARIYRRSMKNLLYQEAESPVELERARREFDLRISEVQLIAHAGVVVAAHSASSRLADAFGRLKEYTARLAVDTRSVGDDSERQELIDELDGPVAERLRELRRVMREDLGVAEE